LIPRIIHQTWRDRAPPRDMAQLARTWRELNAGWHYVLWTDRENRQLIERCAPWFLPTYDAYPKEIMRVDAFRYFLMFHVGGVYADLDFECLRPLDHLVAGAAALVAPEPHEHFGERVVRASRLRRVVANAFLASRPGHSFWPHVFEALAGARACPGPLEATGPFLLTRALDSWRGPDPVSVAPAEALYPLSKRRVWAGALADTGARGRLRAQGAFAVHHWMGTWVRTGGAPDDAALPPEPPLRLVVAGQVVQTGTLGRDRRLEVGPGGPLVSALMVTRDRPGLAACSIECFRNQTWPSRELVIVDDSEADALARLVAALDDPRVRLLRLPSQGQPLGALRNRAVSEARGDIVCQWDDDDLFHPERIALQLSALTALEANACVLERETLWWPRSARVARSGARWWESSLVARKAALPPYPDLRRGEDTHVVHALARAGRLAVLDEPRLQVYVVHARNTFPAAHFERFWRASTERREGPAARAWVRAQASCLPVERVVAALDDPPVISCPPVAAELTPIGVEERPPILILTPVKDAARHLPGFLRAVCALAWPRDRLALGFLESDSRDRSYQRLAALRAELQGRFQRVALWKRDFGFRPGVPRWDPRIQRTRRSLLARCRNELLERALAPGDQWVLWLDADVQSVPTDLIARLLAARKDVVVPHVVSARTGDTFDLNTWRLHPATRDLDWSPWMLDGILQPPRGLGRQYLGELRDHRVVEVDAVGGSALLVRADLHRAGVVFPHEPVRGLIETEGLAVLAREHGSACVGLPDVRVVHA
jgi:glycosyltransferase involved in cell wall biosynthesis